MRRRVERGGEGSVHTTRIAVLGLGLVAGLVALSGSPPGANALTIVSVPGTTVPSSGTTPPHYTVPPPRTIVPEPTTTTTTPENEATRHGDCREGQWRAKVDRFGRGFASRRLCLFYVDGTPAEKDFYADHHLVRRRHGRLISHQLGSVDNDFDSYRVKYHSRSVQGADIAVTGFVLIPHHPATASGSPVVTWGHGTVTTVQACGEEAAPSRYLESTSSSSSWMTDLARAGYIVAATDYEGMGHAHSRFPYLVGDSSGRGMLDIVRALRDMPVAHPNGQTFAYGFSQGGHASLFAAQIAKGYTPEIDLVGAVAAAPATELPLFPAAIDADLSVNYYLGMLMGFNAAYPDARIDQLFNPTAVARLNRTLTECDESLATVSRDERVAGPNQVEPWATLLQRNNPGRRRTDVPIYMLQGTDDNTTLKPLNDILFARQCSLGQVVERVLIPDRGHDPSSDLAVPWITSHAAGAPFTTSCTPQSTNSPEGVADLVDGSALPTPLEGHDGARFEVRQTAGP